MHGRQRTSDIGGGGSPFSFFPFHSLLLPSPFPFICLLFPTSLSSLLIQVRDLVERCKLPQQVQAEPDHQTHVGAFIGKIEAFFLGGGIFLVLLTDRT